jgi:hypothetical protein
MYLLEVQRRNARLDRPFSHGGRVLVLWGDRQSERQLWLVTSQQEQQSIASADV